MLTPTRELAAQIGDSFATYGRHLKLSCAVVFGGVGQDRQVKALARGVDVLVATPGRLLDLMGQGLVRLDRLEVFVLDEADRMLDMGFIHDVQQSDRGAARAAPDAVLLGDHAARGRAPGRARILSDPVKVEAHPVASTVELVEQRVMFVEKADKRPLLGRCSRTPRSTARWSSRAPSTAPTGSSGSSPRTACRPTRSTATSPRTPAPGALERFRTGAGRVLVATDIAARGIDVEGITHVINYDLPNVPESYVHRIGRTARAGRSGVAISFCDAEERAYLKGIEALIKTRIQVVADHPWHAGPSAPPQPAQGLAAGLGPAPVPPTAAPPPARPARGRRRASGRGLSMQVLVRDNDVDFALKQLKRKLRREGLFRELKRRRAYEKPSERRAREKIESVRRRRKALRKRLEREGY